MEHLLNSRVRDIQISGIRQFFQKVSQVEDAISLTIGLPDFDTPKHIREAGKRAIDQGKTVYTPNAGLLSLRKGIAGFVREQYGLEYDPEAEIIVTNGASQAIDIVFRTLLEAGGEVILPGPVYPGYEPLIRLCGGNSVYVDTTGSGFKLTAEHIRQALTDQTRIILLPYPSNPTGVVLNETELREIAGLLAGKNVFVVADEIYSELVYERPHCSIASFAEIHDQTVVINGLSKSHAMTGWRIGYTLAPAYITKHMLKVHQYSVTCASSVSQYAAVEALTEGKQDAEPMRQEYVNRRDYVVKRLEDMGLPVQKPEGAFYVFPSIRSYGLRSYDFAEKLLFEHKVAVVPGSAFSIYGEGYIRISYACSWDSLKQGMEGLESFVNKLQSHKGRIQ